MSMQKLTFHVNTQGKLVDLVQKEVTILLQSALDVALSVVRANPDVLEGLGAQLEGLVEVYLFSSEQFLKTCRTL